MAAFARLLKELSVAPAQLSSLNLEAKSLTAEQVEELVSAIPHPNAVTQVVLNRNAIRTASTLARVLWVFPNLKVLEAGRTNLAEEGFAEFAAAISAHEHLQFLDLSRNNIVDGAMISFLPALSCTTLTSLSLRDNQITGDAMMELVKPLMTGTTRLEQLDLGLNRLSDAGTMALATALELNCGLTHLSLDTNGISVVGAKSLAQALTTNTTLQRLSIMDNVLGDDGLSALEHVLETNSTLTELALRGNRTILAHTSI
eukprot:m.24491 g.24491  ORF g.24491 m.24491 type:complete len:258 (-) comp8596_c0_seq1:404-1177(-)